MRFLGSRSLYCVSLAAALGALFAVPASAQTPTGRITGTVRNGQGAPLAARVTATNSVTGATKSTTTSAEGTYARSSFPAKTPSSVRVHARPRAELRSTAGSAT